MKDRSLLEAKLESLYPHQLVRLTEPWEQCSWSKSYRAELIAGEVVYLKGTPRNRPEARTTAILHSYAPKLIPAVLDEDLFPEHSWCWFLLENAGDCSYDTITPECATEAAFHMGTLQRIVGQDVQLAQYLPQCRADNLQTAVLDVCEWAYQTSDKEAQEDLLTLQERLVRAKSFFEGLQNTLAYLPATCVHGDFWSGNIACGEESVRFIDWGDAVWGVGSASIVNLLESAGDQLTGHEAKIWQAYARGWEKDLSQEFIRGSRAASLICSLVVDVEIAKCRKKTTDILPGLMPLLKKLVRLCKS